MHAYICSEKISTLSKSIVVGDIFILVNLIVWYYYTSAILREVIDETCFIFSEKLLLYVVLFISLVVSVLTGALLATKQTNQKLILLAWSLIGVFSSIFMMLGTVKMFNIFVLLFLLPLVGLSFGLGLPICMAIFANMTSEDNRARFGALAILLTFVGIFSFGFIMTTNLPWNAFVLTVWRSLAIISILVLRIDSGYRGQKKSLSIISLLKDRSVLLYLIPWSTFSMVNYLSWPIGNKIYGENLYSFVLVSNIVAGFAAIVAGFAADKVGRKRTLLVGFIIFGIGYAMLGINPFNIYAWYLYTFIDGVAWGIFFVIFVFTVWGDLARENSSEKYYAIGILPYSFSGFLRVILGPLIADIVSEYAVFSFAAFFLFLAVVPLMFAPETLPERVIRERELRSYIERAKRVREKFTKG